jgi:hypothetical protein
MRKCSSPEWIGHRGIGGDRLRSGLYSTPYCGRSRNPKLAGARLDFLRPFGDRRDVLQLLRRSWPRAGGRRVLRDWRRSLGLQLASALLRRPALAHPTQDPAPKPRIGYQPAFLPKTAGLHDAAGPAPDDIRVCRRSYVHAKLLAAKMEHKQEPEITREQARDDLIAFLIECGVPIALPAPVIEGGHIATAPPSPAMNSRRRRLICPSCAGNPMKAEIARPKPVSPLPPEPAPDRAAAR